MKFLILGFAVSCICMGETYYVRPDGGTATQCDGRSNTAYPGAGENRDCAWAHPFWALDSSGRSWRFRGGDTLLIEPGAYPIGLGAPNTAWCSPEGAFACVAPPLPSGPTAQTPTRLLGSSWNSGCSAAPEFWGTQRVATVLSLDGTSNAIVDCLEITDHSGCVEFHPDSGVRCERDRHPYGDWASIGIYAQDSKNIALRHLNIHGLAEKGIHAGRLSDWTVEDVRIAGNGSVGWDGDLGGDSSNSGTLTFRRWKVEWNGCAETWPSKQPDGCWAQGAGGYGDGVGTAASSGRWIIEDSEFSHNTSDGLDLLYLETVRGERPSVEIRRTIAHGNAGNQIKVTGRSVIVNTLAVGNCMFFLNKPFGRHMGGAFSGDHCRALGSAVSLFMEQGSRAFLVNSTVVGQGDGLFTFECRAAGGRPPSCDGSEGIWLQNNIFVGYGDYLGQEEAALLWDPENFTRGRVDYNIIHRLKNAPCSSGSRNVCSDPMFVDSNLDSFDFRLRSGSPAIDTGLAAGALDGVIPGEDFTGVPRPQGAAVDRGAYEFGTTTAPPLVTALTSSASGQPDALAPGSLVSVYGRRLSSASATAQSLPLPTRLGDTQVLFGAVPAALIYTSDTQINLLVPDLTPGVNTTVTVLRGSSRTTPVPVTVIAFAPAIFELSAGGERRAAITDAAGTLVTSRSGATPGQVLIAYCTGLGASDPLPGSGGLRVSRTPPRVTVDGRDAIVQFAGPNPAFPGLDQINFILPSNTPTGREVQAWIEQSGRRSNVFSLPLR